MTIEAKNLLKVYGKRKVVNNVDIYVERGEVVGLLGPNGAGKTTTFYMVVGLIKPNKGSITIDNKNISKYPMHKRARLGLGYLPQEASVFRKLTVEENILCIWQLRGGAPKLHLKEKVELLLRKRERSWWKREKYGEYYEKILIDFTDVSTSQEGLNLISEDELKLFELKPKEKAVILKNTSKIYYLSMIINELGLNFDDYKSNIVTFILDLKKVYKLGKKRLLDEFLNLLWKIKKDEIENEFRETQDYNRKIELLDTLLEILDVKNDLVKTEIPTKINEFEKKEITFLELISNLEKFYWLERKISINNDIAEFDRIEKLKNKEKIKEELEKYLSENGFRPNELRESLECVSWTRGDSKKIQLEDVLDEFNISHIRHSKGSDLSGGERRRVEIARAVAIKPSFLLLDEPFAGIDPIAVAGIKQMIVLLKNRNIGVLITDHNVRETLKIIDRGYILSDGKVIEEGTKQHLANSPIARKHYLGEDFLL